MKYIRQRPECFDYEGPSLAEAESVRDYREMWDEVAYHVVRFGEVYYVIAADVFGNPVEYDTP